MTDVRSLRWLVWLAPVCGAAAVVLTYRATYEAEAGLYAGAEPALAGAFVALPFVTLALAQLGFATASAVDPSRRRQLAWVVAGVALAVVSVVGAVAVLR